MRVTGRRQSPTKSVRKDTAQPRRGTTTERTGTSWSGVALTAMIVALLGIGVWWGWQAYPELFGQGPGDTPPVAEQAVPIDALGEISQDAEIKETKEAVASTEDTPPPDDTQRPAASAEPVAEDVEQVVEQPATVSEKAAPAVEDEVTRLLAAAETNLKAQRLTSPEWNNAWDNYQQVLELVPAHPDAIKGMEQVIESYVELFGAAVEQEAFDKAADDLAQIRELYPDYPALEDGERRLAAARQARSARLAKMKAIREHLESFETALRRNDLDEATGYLGRISALDANAPELADGRQRLAEARQAELKRQRQAEAERHAGLFEAAMQEGKLQKAANHLAHIRAMDPDSPVLGAAEQRLADAREVEQERQRQVEMERQRRESEARVRVALGEMVSISGGRFRMGDMRGEGVDREKPVHSVTVPDFKLGKFEVTFAQWDACVADGGCGRYTPSDEGWGRGNRPVMNVSWDDIRLFIDWLNAKTNGNFRLPSEAEWEYAARAGSTTVFSWGNSIGSNRANCNSYVGPPTDGSAWTSGDCGLRVIRSGSWRFNSWSLRSADRRGYTRDGRSSDIGFRLAQDK